MRGNRPLLLTRVKEMHFVSICLFMGLDVKKRSLISRERTPNKKIWVKCLYKLLIFLTDLCLSKHRYFEALKFQRNSSKTCKFTIIKKHYENKSNSSASHFQQFSLSADAVHQVKNASDSSGFRGFSSSMTGSGHGSGQGEGALIWFIHFQEP